MRGRRDLERRLLSLRPAAPAEELRERVLARTAIAAGAAARRAAARRAPARRGGETLRAAPIGALRLAWAAALVLAGAIPLVDHLALRGASGAAAGAAPAARPSGAPAAAADLAAQIGADEPLVRALLAGRRSTFEPNDWDRRESAGLEGVL